MDRKARRFRQEQRTLEVMLGIYCRGLHDSGDALCSECRELLDYALKRLEKCPFGEDKPKCSQCRIHCYTGPMRERVREVMKYAGPRMVSRHPVLAMRHVIHGLRHRPENERPG